MNTPLNAHELIGRETQAPKPARRFSFTLDSGETVIASFTTLKSKSLPRGRTSVVDLPSTYSEVYETLHHFSKTSCAILSKNRPYVQPNKT